jgi:hypothetical protein
MFGGLLVGLLMALGGCQFKEKCGDEPYKYKAGLCYPVDAGGDKDAAVDEKEQDGGPPEEGGVTGAAQYCKATCDLTGACLADGPLGGFLAQQLAMLGFEGTDRTGCVSFCEEHSSGEGDEQALKCVADAESDAMCSDTNYMPSVDATNVCCKDHADSEYCVEMCKALQTQPLAYGMVPTCAEILK